MWGIDVRCAASEVVDAAREQGLLLLTAGPRTVRLLPPLICTPKDVGTFKNMMHSAMSEMNRRNCDDIQISQALAEDTVDIFDLLSPWSEAQVVLPRTLSSVAENIGAFSVARWNGVVVGCISRREWNDSIWEVRSLAVAGTAQRLGVGRKLLSALIKESKQRQIRELFALSASPEFFLNSGFTVQHRGRYPFKESSDCVNCSWFSDCRETAVALDIQADIGLLQPANTNIHMEALRRAADEMV